MTKGVSKMERKVIINVTYLEESSFIGKIIKENSIT